MYAPKRKVKKIIGSDEIAPAAGSLLNYTLYTAVSDGETLTRVVGNVDTQAPITGASGSGHVGLALCIVRDGGTPSSLVADISGREAEQLLWTQKLKMQRIQNVFATKDNILVDTKSQRKLRAGDSIRLLVHAISIDPEIGYMLNVFVKQP